MQNISEFVLDEIRSQIIDHVWNSFITYVYAKDASALALAIMSVSKHGMKAKVTEFPATRAIYVDMGKRFDDEERTVVKEAAVFAYDYIKTPQGRVMFDQRIKALEETLWDKVPPHLK